jgi:hypothetical protein
MLKEKKKTKVLLKINCFVYKCYFLISACKKAVNKQKHQIFIYQWFLNPSFFAQKFFSKEYKSSL